MKKSRNIKSLRDFPKRNTEVGNFRKFPRLRPTKTY